MRWSFSVSIDFVPLVGIILLYLFKPKTLVKKTTGVFGSIAQVFDAEGFQAYLSTKSL